MKNLRIRSHNGEGQGKCKMCADNGRPSIHGCFLYEVEGYEGCYCCDCVKKIIGGCNDENESKRN